MRKELQDKLFSEFPLLYGDRTKSMQVTLMCWGISCSDGWFDLLYEASKKMEPVIQKIKEKNKQSDCYTCGCKYYEHRSMPSGERLCRVIHRFPYVVSGHSRGVCIPQWKRDMIQAWTNEWNYKKPGKSKVSRNGRFKRLLKIFGRLLKDDWKYTKYRWLARRLYKYINRGLGLLYKAGLHYKKPCYCNTYESFYPRAVQVKEKYGTLRFYMSHCNDEIDEAIRTAEDKSETTCETCGSTGELRNTGWLVTLCDEHWKAYQLDQYGKIVDNN